MEAANQALLDREPSMKDMGEILRREARTNLNNLLERFSVVDKVAPQIPAMKKRLGEVEENCREFKSLYRNLCLRDDVYMLTNNLKAEMSMYMDSSMK